MDPKALAEIAEGGALAAAAALAKSELANETFSKLVGGVASDIGELIRLPLAERLLNRRIETMERVAKKLSDAGIKNPRPVALKLLIPAIENATFEDDDDLRQLWANLIASAGDPTSLDTHPSFVKILQDLTYCDAQLLASLAGSPSANPVGMIALVDIAESGPQQPGGEAVPGMLQRQVVTLAERCAYKRPFGQAFGEAVTVRNAPQSFAQTSMCVSVLTKNGLLEAVPRGFYFKNETFPGIEEFIVGGKQVARATFHTVTELGFRFVAACHGPQAT